MLQKEKLSGGKKKNKKKAQDAVDLLKKGMESKKETKTSSVAYQVSDRESYCTHPSIGIVSCMQVGYLQNY
jgi:hypothetical protein